MYDQHASTPVGLAASAKHIKEKTPVFVAENESNGKQLGQPSQGCIDRPNMSVSKATGRSKKGKGSRVIDRVTELLVDESKWVKISSHDDYYYPGFFSDNTNQHLLYCEDITSLKSSGCDLDFLWRDIQLSKGKTNGPRPVKLMVGRESNNVELQYRMAPCAGVKQCPTSDCHYTVAIREHHKCPNHGKELEKKSDCPVYFIYLKPVDKGDNRRWIAGLVLHQKEPSASLHSHSKPPPSKLLTSTLTDITNAKDRCPSLTPHCILQGDGVGYSIGYADKAANNLGKVQYALKKAKGPRLSPHEVIHKFKEYADEIDENDERFSGCMSGGASLKETTREKYRRLGRPYLRSAGLQDDMKYILVMSPLMAEVLAAAPFIQADITFDETKEYPYLFNVTAFDEITMKWIIVCRIRITKQNAGAYSLCFKLMFEQYTKECSNFKVGETLVGVIVDWSDAEAQGLRLAVGNDLADKLLKGCQVHWIRSFQRVSAKVAKLGNPEKQKIEVEAFKLVAFAITKAKAMDQVLKLFQALCGREKLADMEHIVPGIEGHHINIVDGCSDWTSATNWVQWWTCLPHLRMLCPCFSYMDSSTWKMAPPTTNAVERKNLDSKTSCVLDLKSALIRIYKLDKSVCLQYIAASESVRLTCRESTSEARKADTERKRRERAKKTSSP